MRKNLKIHQLLLADKKTCQPFRVDHPQMDPLQIEEFRWVELRAPVFLGFLLVCASLYHTFMGAINLRTDLISRASKSCALGSAVNVAQGIRIDVFDLSFGWRR